MDRPTVDADTVRCLREQLANLERRERPLAAPKVRHDIANAVGAARNALALVDENPGAAEASRFVQIARRNIELAAGLLDCATLDGTTAPAADAPSDARSGRNERNDLGSTDERDHRDTLGL